MITTLFITVAFAAFESVPFVDAVSDEQFVAAAKAGFERDYKDAPKAKWLGSSQDKEMADMYVVFSHVQPNVEVKCSDGMAEVVSRPLDELIAERQKATASFEVKKMAFVAWSDSRGIFNVVFNGKLGDAEMLTLGAARPKDVPASEWYGWNPHYVGAYEKGSWIRLKDGSFTWFILGEDENEAGKILRDLRIVCEVDFEK